MKTKSFEQILRLGCGEDMVSVWNAVVELCECNSPSRRLELIARLEGEYRSCLAEYERTEKLIDTFKSLPDEPALIEGGTVVGK